MRTVTRAVLFSAQHLQGTHPGIPGQVALFGLHSAPQWDVHMGLAGEGALAGLHADWGSCPTQQLYLCCNLDHLLPKSADGADWTQWAEAHRESLYCGLKSTFEQS